MNIYDKKQINCMTCGRFIGEVDAEANILLPRCGLCLNSDSDENDILSYIADRFENTVKNVIVCH